ncbi:hypothetical protein WDU94_001454, partial [Cyamophila willieti]
LHQDKKRKLQLRDSSFEKAKHFKKFLFSFHFTSKLVSFNCFSSSNFAVYSLHLRKKVLNPSFSFVNRMSIQNLNTFDPFADAFKGSEDDVQDGLVHIRIQQRNGRKTLTTVQGLSSEYDLKKIVRACKKEFACNGTVIEHPEYGEVLQLQGDQRENICQWLTKTGLAKPEQLKVHGF